MDTLEKQSKEITEWSEEKMHDLERMLSQQQHEEDSLFGELNKARVDRQRADETEKTLLNIKTKIEQMRIKELNDDIIFLSDPKNPEFYKPQEATHIYD